MQHQLVIATLCRRFQALYGCQCITFYQSKIVLDIIQKIVKDGFGHVILLNYGERTADLGRYFWARLMSYRLSR